MSLQLSTTVRNARLDAIETAIGAAPVLRIFTGTVPATPATADSGTLLVEMTLPSDWMAAASGGSKAKAGTWQDLSADGSGEAGHYRIYASGGATCHMQGNCSVDTAGDLNIADLTIVAGQSVTVTGFTLTEPNA